MSAAASTETLPWHEHHLRIQYLTDENGNRVAVVLPMEDWEVLMDGLEDLYDIRAYENAKAEEALLGEEPIPWERLKAEFEEEDGARPE